MYKNDVFNICSVFYKYIKNRNEQHDSHEVESRGTTFSLTVLEGPQATDVLDQPLSLQVLPLECCGGSCYKTTSLFQNFNLSLTPLRNKLCMGDKCAYLTLMMAHLSIMLAHIYMKLHICADQSLLEPLISPVEHQPISGPDKSQDRTFI